MADWIFVAYGHDRDAMEALAGRELGPASLVELGAVPGQASGLYTLSYSAVPSDVS
jgi:hypothetical protein